MSTLSVEQLLISDKSPIWSSPVSQLAVVQQVALYKQMKGDEDTVQQVALDAVHQVALHNQTEGDEDAVQQVALHEQMKVDEDAVQQVALDRLAVVRQVALDKQLDGDDNAFFVLSVDQLREQHSEWERLLPRVEPHYAVKCNKDPVLLRVLADLGCGFDCASKQEIGRLAMFKPYGNNSDDDDDPHHMTS